MTSQSFAALTLTVSDGNPLHAQVFTDIDSSGSIFGNGIVVGNWSFRQLSGFLGSNPGDPLLELSYSVFATPQNDTTLTVTLTETGYGPLTSSSGDLLLAIGGTEQNTTVIQNALINDSIVASHGLFGGIGFAGNRRANIQGFNDRPFSISEQLVFTGTGRNGGDAILDFDPIFSSVPEPGTLFSGVFAGLCGLYVVAKSTKKRKDKQTVVL